MLREQNVSEGALKVIKAVLSSQLDLQDTPHALFMRGELGDAVDAADLVDVHEGARVEVIGGEVVVSPAPALDHGAIVEDVSEAWAFGEAVVLPDPFGLKIPTDEWRTWA